MPEDAAVGPIDRRRGRSRCFGSSPSRGRIRARHLQPKARSVEARRRQVSPHSAHQDQHGQPAMRIPTGSTLEWPTGPSVAALLQVVDEPLKIGYTCRGAGPGLLEVAAGGAGIQKGVTNPAVIGEEERDAVAVLPGFIDVPLGFIVLDGLLIVAERLAGVPGMSVEGAQLVFGDATFSVIVGGGDVQGLPVAGQGCIQVFQ
jgi:hypothetical protein